MVEKGREAFDQLLYGRTAAAAAAVVVVVVVVVRLVGWKGKSIMCRARDDRGYAVADLRADVEGGDGWRGSGGHGFGKAVRAAVGRQGDGVGRAQARRRRRSSFPRARNARSLEGRRRCLHRIDVVVHRRQRSRKGIFRRP